MKHPTMSGFFAVLFAAESPSIRTDRITFSQTPDPFIALEGTSGNPGFVTLKNNDPDHVAFLTNILAFRFNATGEFDDQTANLALAAPNPTAQNPVQIGPDGTATIKFSWDAAGNIEGKDVDGGEWACVFTVDHHYVKGTDFFTVVKPSPWSLSMLGPVLLVAGRYRFTSRAVAPIF